MPSADRLDEVLTELKRRRVFRVALAYAAVGIAAVSIASDFLPALRLPEWSVTFVAVAVVLGFPIALILAWLYDITPRGIRRDPGPAGPLQATVPAGSAAAAGPAGVGAEGRPQRRDHAAAFISVGMLLAIALLGALSRVDALALLQRSDGASIAVLPFENHSGDPADDFFAAGIHEEVMTQLYRLGGVTVIARSSVMQYRDGAKPARIVGEELGVSTVLEASVRRAAERVRIDARLIDARTDRQIWAESYDGELTDVLGIQAEIAQKIADALQARLAPAARTQLAGALPQPLNPAMYETYLRGLYEAGEGRHAAAVMEFRRALDIDASYAPAHAALARSHYALAFFGESPPGEAFGAMKSAATRALQLDPQLADAHAALALHALHYAWDWQRADQHFRRALELSPNHAQVRHDYAHYLLAVGRTRASVDESDRAVRLDPGNTMLKACAGWHDFTDREYDNAVAQALSALMMMPGAWWPEIILGWSYLHRGQSGQAIAALRSAVTNSGGTPFALASLAQALAQSGERTPARRMLQELMARTDERYVSAYDIAVVHAALGDAPAAVTWLRAALDERAAMLVNIGWDPRFDGLRDDAGFRSVVAEMNLPARPTPRPAAPRRTPRGM